MLKTAGADYVSAPAVGFALQPGLPLRAGANGTDEILLCAGIKNP
jgi:hypothetical protein